MKWNFISRIDWLLIFCSVAIVGIGIVTMTSFSESNNFFTKQLIALVISLVACFAVSFIDFRFLRRTDTVVVLYLFSIGLLLILFLLGHTTNGAQSWFRIGGFSFQPSDFAKLILIITVMPTVIGI